MRLFIAIELPKNVKKEAERMLLELKNLSLEGRFVPSGNMHITLGFLGETDNLAGAAEAMAQAVQGMQPFALHLGAYSSFEHNNESKTSHIAIKGQLDELNALYESLNAALGDRGFKTTKKRFVPHITLGRSVIHDDIAQSELEHIAPPLNASMSVSSIVLYESVRRGNDMVYTPLHKESF